MHFLPESLRLGAILLLANLAQAEEPFVWKWADGDSARYLLTQSMEMAMDGGAAGQINTSSQTQTLMRWAVETIDDGSDAAQLSQRVERVVMESVAPAGQGFSYDSASEDPPAGMAALAAPMFEAMIEHDFTVTMLPSGKVKDVELSDELAYAFDRLPGGAMSSDLVKQMATQGQLEFPDEPLVLNDHWTVNTEVQPPQMGPMRVATEYTYEGSRRVDDRQLEVFSVSIRVEAAGSEEQETQVTIETKSSDGEILFDAELGRIVQSNLTQTMDVTVQVAGREVVNEVVQSVQLRAVAEDESPSMDVESMAVE